MVEILPSSDLAKAEVKRGGFKTKYPWRTIDIGMSFRVPYGAITFKSLYALAARNSTNLNKKFRVVDHGSNVGYEVARLPDVLPEMQFTTPVAEVNIKPVIPNDSPWKVKE